MNTTTNLVPFSSTLRHRVAAIVVRAPETQDQRFAPGPAGSLPPAALDAAARLIRAGVPSHEVKYLAELHPLPEPIRPEVRAIGGIDSMPPAADLRRALNLGDARAEAELHPTREEARPLGEVLRDHYSPSDLRDMGIDVALAEADLRLVPAAGAEADPPTPVSSWAALQVADAPFEPQLLGEVIDSPAPVRHFGDDMAIEVQPKPAAFMSEPEVFEARVIVRDGAGDVTAVLPAAPTRVSRSWSEETVDAAGAERARRDEQTCERLGLALPPAFFALGTTLVDVGVENARKSREEFERLPDAADACLALEQEVRAEDRKSVAAGLSDLLVTRRGDLARLADPAIGRGGFTFGLEPDAARALQADLRKRLGAGGDLGIVTGLEFKDAEVVEGAARQWNRYAVVLKQREVKGAERKQVNLLTRMVEQPKTEDGREQPRRRQVFAVVSEKYGEIDAGKIAHACGDLARGIDGDVRAEVVYDRKRVAIDLLTHTTVQPDAQVVGDVFRTGLRVRSDDTGGGSLVVSSVAYRVACRNYTVVSADGSATRIRHLGDPARLLERLREALQASSGALRTFAAQWSKACGKQASRDLLSSLETERRRRDELGGLVGELLAAADRGRASYLRAQAEVLDGIYRSILEAHDLAPSKAIEDEVISLRRAHFDRRNEGAAQVLSPAAFSNGLTLWAQDQGRHTADAAEVLAGRIVSGDEVLAWIGAPGKAA